MGHSNWDALFYYFCAMLDNHTICALATGSGTGAISLIRVSGTEAIEITQKIFSPFGKSTLTDAQGYSLHFGKIVQKEEIVDEVLISVFRAPKSFTGENMTEISCHGSAYIQQQIINLLIDHGASMARPGEFTQRAFFNGKMDLSQAEAVADLIASNSRAAHKMAMDQMRGGFAKELTGLRGELLEFASMIELELDFAEEEVEFADRSRLTELATRVEKHIASLAGSFKLGNALKNGIPVAIVGETNVGKSTLLNAFLKEEKAIVSDIHGTTRDVIEDTIHLGGVEFRFIDTAGIRKTEDTIENLGIERTFQQISKATIVLLLIDLSKPHQNWIEQFQQVKENITDQHLIVVGNKSDQNSNPEFKPTFDHFDFVKISAKQNSGIIDLEEKLIKHAQIDQLESANLIVSNARHYEALTRALEAIRRALDGLANGITGDFLAQDIRECMHYLGEITGTISTDEMLGFIFKNFCIGK